jgi:hypothetical protein
MYLSDRVLTKCVQGPGFSPQLHKTLSRWPNIFIWLVGLGLVSWICPPVPSSEMSINIY